MKADYRHVFRPDLPRRNVALAAVTVAGVLFAVMSVMTKILHSPDYVGRAIPASEAVLARFACGLLALLPLQFLSGVNLLGSDRKRLLLRGIWGGFAVYFYFLSIQQTTLAHAQLLNYGSIIFAPLFAWIFLSERIDTRTGAAILLALLGISLITLQHGLGGALNIGDLFGLISGILAGASITEIRRLRQSESAWTVFFYLCLVGLPIALVACVLQPLVWPTPAGWAALAVMGIASVGAQMLLTFGYKYLRAAEGTLVSMTQLVYNSVAGAMLFAERLTPWTYVGGALILGAALWMAVVPRRSPVAETAEGG